MAQGKKERGNNSREVAPECIKNFVGRGFNHRFARMGQTGFHNLTKQARMRV